MSTLPDSEMTPHVRKKQGVILAGQVAASHLPSLTQAASPTQAAEHGSNGYDATDPVKDNMCNNIIFSHEPVTMEIPTLTRTRIVYCTLITCTVLHH